VVLEKLVQVLSRICFPVIVSASILKLLHDFPFNNEFLFPASQVLLIPRNIIEVHPRAPAPTLVDGLKVAKGPAEVPRRQD